MALSIDAIHKPLNDFFLTHFRTDADSIAQFRFDQFGSVVDEDFIDPNHPELGCSPALAREKFSDLVNHVPVEQADGLHIFLSQNSIDSTYFFRLVSPAIAVIPGGADDQTRDALVGAFSAIKNDATRRWEQSTLESSTGLMMQFKPALATPERWYDKDNKDIWTVQSFHVAEASPATPAPAAPDIELWKLRLADTQFQTVLQAADLASPAAPAAAVVRQPVAPRVLLGARIAPFAAVRMAPAAAVAEAAPPHVGAFTAARPAPPFVLAQHDGVQRRFRALDFNKRILVGEMLATTQPTQPAATNSISIAFEYCLVKIKRPWLSDALVNDTSWCIPATAKGSLTAADHAGATLPLLPIAAVAIKNLTIEANWADADIAAAKDATDFGPFKVGGEIVNNKLRHEGLQIIGWLVQRMPELPPNGA